MGSVENIIKHAEQYCKAHGSRLTSKRKCVLAGLLRSQKALSAYELAEYCKSEFGETIPAMSVYRILGFLKDEHLVHKLNLANKYVACSHITCDHDHGVPQFLICGQCQKVEEIAINKATVTELQHHLAKAGFHLVSQQLELDCLCDACMVNTA